MSTDDLVKGHYSRDDLVEVVLGALAADGVDTSALAYEALAPVDNLHAGFLPATLDVISRLGVTSSSSLLDVGCGIGGPSRAAAATTGCRVTGVDLSPDFVEAARRFTDLVGLNHRATFEESTALGLPFDDDSFDAAMMIHVGMNMPDKGGVFAEVARTTRSGGRFVVYDQMRVGPGDLSYPLPWADDERSSFVESSEEYIAHLEAAGFEIDAVIDRTREVVGPPTGGDSSLSPGVFFGEDFATAIGNNIQAHMAGNLAATVIEAHVA